MLLAVRLPANEVMLATALRLTLIKVSQKLVSERRHVVEQLFEAWLLQQDCHVTRHDRYGDVPQRLFGRAGTLVALADGSDELFKLLWRVAGVADIFELLRRQLLQSWDVVLVGDGIETDAISRTIRQTAGAVKGGSVAVVYQGLKSLWIVLKLNTFLGMLLRPRQYCRRGGIDGSVLP